MLFALPVASTTTLPSLPPVRSVKAFTSRPRPLASDRLGHAHLLAGEAQTLLVQIHHDDPRARELGELDDARGRSARPR